MEDDDEKLNPYDYFNSDANLLIILVLLEGYYRGESVFTLEQFLKGEYWKIEEITNEIRDTQDYSSAEDLVLQRVFHIVKDLGLGKIKRISVSDLHTLTEEVVREALNKKDSTEDDVMYYTSILREIAELDTIRATQRAELFKTGRALQFGRANANRVNFTEEDFHRHLEYISATSAPFIEIEFDFNDQGTNQLNEEIEELILNFSQDDYIEHKPRYKSKRLYFSKQLENFFEYIKVLPEIEGYVNVPFSSLLEHGFEVVKVMSFLERAKRLKVRNWNDTEFWNVKFHEVPITLSSLLGQVKRGTTETLKTEGIKLNLSFSPQTATMLLTDQNGKEYKIKIQGQVQKEVIRAVFEHPQNTYTEWSLYDISETLGGEDVDETAVKNAIYQFNRKVKLSIPEVENLFELTKHSAQLNPKYLNKN